MQYHVNLQNHLIRYTGSYRIPTLIIKRSNGVEYLCMLVTKTRNDASYWCTSQIQTINFFMTFCTHGNHQFTIYNNIIALHLVRTLYVTACTSEQTTRKSGIAIPSESEAFWFHHSQYRMI